MKITQLKNLTLINGDCLKVMDSMIAQGVKVNAIITSPPYNMNLRVHSGKYMSKCNWRNHNKEFCNKYENYTDDLPMEDYFNFQKDFIEKGLSLSDRIFYNNQFITGNKVALCKLLGYFAENFKELIIWDKINAQSAMAQRTLNSQFEIIVVFEKSKPYNRMFDGATFEKGTLSNLWQIKRERNTLIKAGFPKSLVEKILLNFSLENDIILDPFMGSGTTGVVCKGLNRKFIGIELDINTFNDAEERIKNENCYSR